jgi:hypothetical protein
VDRPTVRRTAGRVRVPELGLQEQTVGLEAACILNGGRVVARLCAGSAAAGADTLEELERFIRAEQRRGRRARDQSDESKAGDKHLPQTLWARAKVHSLTREGCLNETYIRCGRAHLWKATAMYP